MNIPKSLLTILNVVLLQSKVRQADHTVRRVPSVVEVVEMDPVSKEIVTNEVFRWNPKKDNFEYSGKSALLDRIQRDYGLTKEYVSKELERRRMVLEWMILNDIRRNYEVGQIIREYYIDPEGMANKVKLRLTA
jgi:flagellar protein FlaI